MASFSYEFRVRFADVDHAGIVYYPRFFDYFHVAFEEFFRDRLGDKAYRRLLDERQIGFPAVHAECDYLAPLRFSDSVQTTLRCTRIGSKSLSFSYEVEHLEESDEEGRVASPSQVCARGKVVCAVVDLSSFQAIPCPADLRDLFLELSPGLG